MHAENRDEFDAEFAQERARVSPLRARMLDLYEKDRSRSMDAATLADELAKEGWEVSKSQVSYHLRKLQDLRLIPSPCLGS